MSNHSHPNTSATTSLISSNTAMAPFTIYGLTQSKIIRYMSHGGRGVTPKGGHQRVLEGRSLFRSNAVETITEKHVSSNPWQTELIIQTQCQSQSQKNTKYPIRIHINDCHFSSEFGLCIQSTRSIVSSYCPCKDNYGFTQRQQKKCKHTAAVLESACGPAKPILFFATAKHLSYQKKAFLRIGNFLKSYYQIGDIQIPFSALPSTFFICIF
eukprot:784388_1